MNDINEIVPMKHPDPMGNLSSWVWVCVCRIFMDYSDEAKQTTGTEATYRYEVLCSPLTCARIVYHDPWHVMLVNKQRKINFLAKNCNIS